MELLRRSVGRLVEVRPTDGALHVILGLPDDWDDDELTRMAATENLDLRSMTEMSRDHRDRKALVLGFGGLRDHEVHDGVAHLAEVIERYALQRSGALSPIRRVPSRLPQSVAMG